MRGTKGTEDGIPSYLNRLTQAPLLTAGEEIALTWEARAGNEEARRRLAESNMRLVINIARSYHSKTMPLEDLIQEGSIGLMQAIKRFDPSKGFRFSTYATHWIRQSIGRAIDNKAKTIRLPAHVSQTLRKMEKAKQDWMKAHGVEPTHDELCQIVGIHPAKASALISMHQDLLSLEIRLGDSDSTTLGSVLRDKDQVSAEECVLSSELTHELEEIVASLDDNERKVLALRLAGLTATDDASIPPDRARALTSSTMRKLRAAAAQKKLKEYLE